MTRPASILHALAGRPAQDRVVELDEPALCRVCAGLAHRAAPYERWQGSGFTDQNKLRYIAGTHVCEACVWAHAWNPPPGHPPAAKGKKGVNLRLFSHLYDERGYVYANKGDKPTIRAWLLAPKSPPWFAAIADSGQKHVVPWATMNRDPYVGVVRLEEADVFLDCRIAGEWCEATCELLTAGATKAEIEAGEYRPQTWLRCEERIRAYEARFGAERGGGWFALTVWLSQRDEDAVAERRAAEKEAKADGRRTKGSNPRSRGGPADGGARGVPRGRGERAQALAADPRSRGARDADERAGQRVGDDADPRAADRESDQLALFGDDRADR